MKVFKSMDSTRRSVWLPLLWSASIIIVWFVVAHLLGQQPFHYQPSQKLTRFGALLGQDLVPAEAWRLVASQWLHVHFGHMLFNALIIAIVGAPLARRIGGARVLFLGLAGGTLAQAVTAIVYPQAYFSGASQAYLVLCGLSLLLLPLRSREYRIAFGVAVLGIAAAAALDLLVSESHAIKAGHFVGVIFGAAVGALLRLKPYWPETAKS
jgi:membrane associated rhomboid family serine protease